MSDKLVRSLDIPFELSRDKFTDGEYWAVGHYHDHPGVGFAKTVIGYFEEQYKILAQVGARDLIDKIVKG